MNCLYEQRQTQSEKNPTEIHLTKDIIPIIARHLENTKIQ